MMEVIESHRLGLIFVDEKENQKIFEHFANDFSLLLKVDEGELESPDGRPCSVSVDIDEYRGFVGQMCEFLEKKGELTPFFGVERESMFESTMLGIEQEVFGEKLFKTVEEKASNLLYNLTKNHSFQDGNKRIASACFVRYLHTEGVDVFKLTSGVLAQITLSVAQSNPAQKEEVCFVLKGICESLVAQSNLGHEVDQDIEDGVENLSRFSG